VSIEDRTTKDTEATGSTEDRTTEVTEGRTTEVAEFTEGRTTEVTECTEGRTTEPTESTEDRMLSRARSQADVDRLTSLTGEIIAAAIEVHRALGPGLLEAIYESALAIELAERGMRFERQMPAPARYKGRLLGHYRIDLVVESVVIVEIKSVSEVPPIAHAQLLNYLRLTKIRVGLLINFNSRLLREGIRRFIL
jgi:GxxExxY protein